MRKCVTISVVLAGAFLGSVAMVHAAATEPAVEAKRAEAKQVEKDVRAYMDEGIKLLEAKDYVAAFRWIAGPIAEKTEKEGKLDHAVEVLKAGMGDELLKGLKTARDSKATVDDDGQTVTFDLSAKYQDGATKMIFRKWGQKWYLD